MALPTLPSSPGAVGGGGTNDDDTVALFTKNWFFGASSHTVHFDEAGVMEIKLARKTNTDPAKRAWMILAPS